MKKQKKFLQFLFIANVLWAGIPGALMTLAPDWAKAYMYPWPVDDFLFGIAGSIWLAIGLISVLGMKYPWQMAPVFLLQISYKIIWIIFVGIPLGQGGLMEAWYYVGGFGLMILLFAWGFPYNVIFHNQKPTNYDTRYANR